MEKEKLERLLELSKQQDPAAMERLLVFAHTPVLYQCKRLLNDQKLAEEMTERVLNALSNQIHRIDSVDHLYKWIGNITAVRCMKKREQIQVKEFVPDTQDMSFPSNELSKAETTRVAQILADALPEDQRICLLLSVCSRVGNRSIAQMTGYSEETVAKNVAEAQLGIQEQMRIYQSQGVVFSGSPNIAALLRNAMYLDKKTSAAKAMAKRILPPVSPAPVKPPKRPNHLVKILLCIAGALVIVLLLLIGCVSCGHFSDDAEETTAATTAETTETTLVTTEATTEPTTEPTTESTTEPTTVPTTEETTIPETTEAAETTELPAVPATSTPKTSSNSASSNSSVDLGAPGLDIIKKPSGSDYNKPDDGHTHEYISMGTPGNPTCTKPGRVYRVCKYCNTGIEKDDPNRPALGHDHQLDRVVPPTTTSQGYSIYKCTRCSNTYNTDYVDPLPAAETQPPVVETQAPVVETQVPIAEPQPSVVEAEG